MSAIARQAGVNRSLLYRHPDLRAAVLARAAEPTTASSGGPAASRTSLIADLSNAHDRIVRLSRELAQLRNRLCEQLGEHAWRESGLGGPDATEQLKRRVSELEHHAAELRRQVALMQRDVHAIDHDGLVLRALPDVEMEPHRTVLSEELSNLD